MCISVCVYIYNIYIKIVNAPKGHNTSSEIDRGVCSTGNVQGQEQLLFCVSCLTTKMFVEINIIIQLWY